jgi:hypothetical protein
MALVISKQRSPNYPSISLKDAIDKVRKIYEAEHTHVTSREVVARDLGYNSLNGASLPIIGSLKRYQLLEDAGEGLKISEDAVTILELPETEPQRIEAVRRAAFAPSFFQELWQEFGGKLPSDANLRHYLIRKKFLPKAADELIRVYRDNFKLLGVVDSGYTEGVDATSREMITERTERAEPDTLGSVFAHKLNMGMRPADALGKTAEAMGAPLLSQTLVVSIPRNFKIEIGVRGDEIKKEDLAKIKSQFNRWIEGLEEAFD